MEKAIKNNSWILIIWALISVGLYLSSLYSYLLFHTIAESFSIIIGIALFVIALNTRKFAQNNYVLFLCIAFFFAGLIDFVHTLAYKGMGIFQGFDANLPTQLWIIARYVQSLSLLAAPWFITRRLNIRAAVGFYLSVTLLLLASVFSGSIFPDCFIEGKGLTQFKIISEYAICLVLIASLFLLLRHRQKFDRVILQLFVWSIIFTIISELAFTYYISVYGISNMIGHYFKIFSFYFVYRAIIVTGLENPYRLLFYDLEKNKEELQTILDASPIMIFYKDRENRFIRVNRALAEVMGLNREGIEGKTAFEIYPDQATGYLEDDKEVIASGKSKTGIIEPIDTKMGIRWLQTDKIPYRDMNGSIIGIIGFSIDITERKSMEEEILSLSITDQLTGLHNRRGFLSLAGQQIKLSDRNKNGMMLFFADLDLLKEINDALGHEEGDRAIIEAANILRETFRTSDIIARLGGDEFAVLAIDIRGTKAEVYTARMQHLIDMWNNQINREYKLSISMGCSYYDPENPCSIDDLIARADRLMYEQKQKKKSLILQSAPLSSSNT